MEGTDSHTAILVDRATALRRRSSQRNVRPTQGRPTGRLGRPPGERHAGAMTPSDGQSAGDSAAFPWPVAAPSRQVARAPGPVCPAFFDTIETSSLTVERARAVYIYD